MKIGQNTFQESCVHVQSVLFGSRLVWVPWVARIDQWWMTHFLLRHCNTSVTRTASKDIEVNPTISERSPCFPQLVNFYKSAWGKKMIRQQTFSFSVGASDRSLFDFDSHFLLCHGMTWFYSAAHQANSSPPTYQTLLSSQPFKHTSGWDQVLPPSFWLKTSCLF